MAFLLRSLKRVGLFSLLFFVAPTLGAVLAAFVSSSSQLSLVAVAVSSERDAVIAALGKPIAAALFVSAILGTATMLAWSDGGVKGAVRAVRLVAVLWMCAFALYPGLGSWIPGLGAIPWLVIVAGLFASVLLSCLPRATRPTYREVSIVAVLSLAFFSNLGWRTPDLQEIAGRSFGSQDVVILGLDSMSYDDAKDVLAGFDAAHARTTIFDNAWTTIALTSPAWRSALSGRYPTAHEVLPGAPWRSDGVWLPTQLARAGYEPTLVQDDPATNTYGVGEDVSVPHEQGWRALMIEFSWKSAFPLSVAGGRWWLEALGAPVNAAGRYSYCSSCFRNWWARRMAEKARTGPVFWAVHTCYAHAPIHLSLKEALQVPRWWARSPRGFEGGGNPFFASTSGGAGDVNAVRLESTKALLAETLRWLEDAGVLGKARVVILSDHGPRGPWVPFGTRNHIVMAVYEPGRGEKSVVHAPVSIADVAPTIRRWLGLQQGDRPGRPLPTDGQPPAPRLVPVFSSPAPEASGMRVEAATTEGVRHALQLRADGSFGLARDMVEKFGKAQQPAVWVGAQ